MPIYDIKCQRCETLMRDIVQASDEPQPTCACGGRFERVWMAASKVHIFHEGLYEHLAPDPIHFSSRQKLKSYCKENGLIMDYLEGR